MKKVAFVLISLLLILTSCQEKQKPQSNTPVTLKVLAWDKEQFYQQYGDLYQIEKNFVDLDVVSIREQIRAKELVTEAVDRLMKEQHPDVALINMYAYEGLRENNKLTPLTSFISNSNLDLKQITPAVVNFLQDDTGELFGLAPTFLGQAVYFNKALFHRFGIPLPRDRMTWDELFALAQRFPKEIDKNTPVLGLYDRAFSNPMVMALRIGGGVGYSFYNGREFSINTRSWNDIFKGVIDCVKAGACGDYSAQLQVQDSKKEQQTLAATYPFLHGNIAMAIDDSSLYTRIDQNKEQAQAIDWDVVSFPVHADQPDRGNGMQLNEIFVIPSESNKKEAAWELVQFANGEGYAKIFSRIHTSELLSQEPSSDQSERNLHAFYTLDYMLNTTMIQMRKLPQPVLEKFDELSLKYLAEVNDDRLTVAEMLNQLQANMQSMLQ